MWDVPGPGLEPMSSALAGRFLTTVPPGKSKRDNWLNEAWKVWKGKTKWCSQSQDQIDSALSCPALGFVPKQISSGGLFLPYDSIVILTTIGHWSFSPARCLFPFSMRSSVSFWESPLLILCPLLERWILLGTFHHERWRYHALFFCLPPTPMDQCDLKSANQILSPMTDSWASDSRMEGLVRAHLFWWCCAHQFLPQTLAKVLAA